MDTNRKGNLGEAKVIAHFINEGYNVFTSFGTASEIDLIIEKDGVLQRVSVKSTSHKSKKSNSWIVKVAQKTRTKETDFKSSSFDLVAVYIIPEDRVVIIDSNLIVAKTKLQVKSNLVL